MIREREPDVPLDAELLEQVLSQHEITIAALSRRAGIASKTIYRYLSGERTIPSDCLRAAFELTGDLRIIGLITGSVPIQCVALTEDQAGPAGARPSPVRLPPPEQWLQESCQATKQLAEATTYLAKVWQDREVTESDRGFLCQYRALTAEVRRVLAINDAAIQQKEQSWTAQKQH